LKKLLREAKNLKKWLPKTCKDWMKIWKRIA